MATPTTTLTTSTSPSTEATPGAVAPVVEEALPQVDELQYLPHSTGEPGGVAGSFEDMFAKGPTGSSRQRLVDIGKAWIGTPHGFGGNTPGDELDHSGLVQQAFKKLGITVPRISAAQVRMGPRLPLGKLQPGDLVGWDHSSRNNGADHVAIYVGDGQILEAPKPGLSVRVRSLSEDDQNDGAWGVDMSDYL